MSLLTNFEENLLKEEYKEYWFDDTVFDKTVEAYRKYLMDLYMCRKNTLMETYFDCGKLIGEGVGYFHIDTISDDCIVFKVLFDRKTETAFFELCLSTMKCPKEYREQLALFLNEVNEDNLTLGQYKVNDDGSVSLCYNLVFKYRGIAKSAFARIYKIMFYSLLGYGSCFSQIMNGQELENKKNVYSVYLDKKIYIDKNKMEWKTSGTKTF